MQIYDGRDSFYQWDTNQKLTATGLKAGDKLHFFNLKQSEPLTLVAYVFENTTVVDVPNILLQSPLPIVVYRWIEDKDATYTTEKYEFGVKPRPKPSDYVYTETEVLLYTNLETRINQLEETCDSLEPLYCTLRFSAGGTGSCDKTFAEMWEAHTAGRELLFTVPGTYSYGRGICVDYSNFRKISVTILDGVGYTTASIREDDTVIYQISSLMTYEGSVRDTTGTSPRQVMSQKAVTEELNKKMDNVLIDETTGKKYRLSVNNGKVMISEVE